MAFIDDLKKLIKKYDNTETVTENEDSETVYTEKHERVVKNVDGKRVEEEKTIRVNEQGEYYYV